MAAETPKNATTKLHNPADHLAQHKFPKGNKGGPGRPKKDPRKVREEENAFRVFRRKAEKIIDALIAANPNAAADMLARYDPPPTPVMQPPSDLHQHLHITAGELPEVIRRRMKALSHGTTSGEQV